jgi:hypothetical protein
MGFKPERTGGRNRIYSRPPPPACFIPAAMHLAMVRATERNRELVADLASKRSGLREAQMMRVGWSATANKTGLPDDVPDVIAISDTTRFGERKDALTDLCYRGVFGRRLNSGDCGFWLQCQQFGCEGFLHLLSIGCGKLIFRRQASPCPQRCIIGRA